MQYYTITDAIDISWKRLLKDDACGCPRAELFNDVITSDKISVSMYTILIDNAYVAIKKLRKWEEYLRQEIPLEFFLEKFKCTCDGRRRRWVCQGMTYIRS